MLDGISIAASGLSAQTARMDALAGDIANEDTAGYEQQRVNLATTAGGGVAAASQGPDPQQGPLETTGQPLDLAIEGNGYFRVTPPGGGAPLLTRVGRLNLNSNGQIVTESGASLVPPIQLPTGVAPTSVSIGADGTVAVSGRTIGRINLATVAAPSGLQPAGGGLYAATAASGAPVPATAARVVQGALEGSNVDPVDAAIGVLSSKDAYAFDAGAINAQDEMYKTLLSIRP